MFKETANLTLLPEVSVRPRVFVKKPEGDYFEVVQVQSFERSDFESEENLVSFTLKGRQSRALSDLLDRDDGDVDVKMTFSLGATMVITFSGKVVAFTGELLTLSMLTPLETEVLDDAGSLH